MDLTTLARVKALLPGVDTTHDTLLQQWITDLSAEVEAELGRGAEAVARTEVFSVEPNEPLVRLRGYPVSTVTSVKEDLGDRSFGSSAFTIAATDYSVDENGLLWFHSYRLTGGPRTLQVVYTGGMAATAAAFVTAFPDIAGAMDLQVNFWHKRYRNIGESLSSVVGATYTTHGPIEWLPQLRHAVARHRRVCAA